MNARLKRLLDARKLLPLVEDYDLPAMRQKGGIVTGKSMYSIEGDHHWYGSAPIAMRCWYSKFAEDKPKEAKKLVAKHCKRDGNTCECVKDYPGINLCGRNK